MGEQELARLSDALRRFNESIQAATVDFHLIGWEAAPTTQVEESATPKVEQKAAGPAAEPSIGAPRPPSAREDFQDQSAVSSGALAPRLRSWMGLGVTDEEQAARPGAAAAQSPLQAVRRLLAAAFVPISSLKQLLPVRVAPPHDLVFPDALRAAAQSGARMYHAAEHEAAAAAGTVRQAGHGSQEGAFEPALKAGESAFEAAHEAGDAVSQAVHALQEAARVAAHDIRHVPNGRMAPVEDMLSQVSVVFRSDGAVVIVYLCSACVSF